MNDFHRVLVRMPSLNALMDSLLKEIQRCHVHTAKFQPAVLWSTQYHTRKVNIRVGDVIETRDRRCDAPRCVDLLKNIDPGIGAEKGGRAVSI